MSFVVFHIGAMHADYVTDLAHYGALFEAVRIDDHHSVVNLLTTIVAHGAHRAVDHLERADPLALAALHRVGRVNDHPVHVQLVALRGVQRVVLDLSRTGT